MAKIVQDRNMKNNLNNNEYSKDYNKYLEEMVIPSKFAKKKKERKKKRKIALLTFSKRDKCDLRISCCVIIALSIGLC